MQPNCVFVETLLFTHQSQSTAAHSALNTPVWLLAACYMYSKPFSLIPRPSFSRLGTRLVSPDPSPFHYYGEPLRGNKNNKCDHIPPGHHSTVTIVLKQESDCTKLVLSQTEVPDSDAERTREGWKRYIFESIKSTFGFGARLL